MWCPANACCGSGRANEPPGRPDQLVMASGHDRILLRAVWRGRPAAVAGLVQPAADCSARSRQTPSPGARSIAASFRFFLTVARGTGVLDYRIHNLDALRGDRGCLVVANHPTLIDYVILASVMPETDCLVKSALLRNPFVSGVIRAADYLINSEAEPLLAASQQRLAQGDTLLIFPEGTRTRPGEAIALQRGAANIAVRCRSDLRIVLIHCSEHLLDKKKPLV